MPVLFPFPYKTVCGWVVFECSNGFSISMFSEKIYPEKSRWFQYPNRETFACRRCHCDYHLGHARLEFYCYCRLLLAGSLWYLIARCIFICVLWSSLSYFISGMQELCCYLQGYERWVSVHLLIVRKPKWQLVSKKPFLNPFSLRLFKTKKYSYFQCTYYGKLLKRRKVNELSWQTLRNEP